ncbi:proprotein convertase subtilisin/kexin type 1 inhibitor, like [Fundulus heteroclitus]|uniref:proprotein convertase subtilisin/kexin type 1 inhibitor, like n=1 Tax=Fundulus heteroclitus TaxID=8078 RepID=UPI00165CBD10|nr:proprotein convertase subtilisin/kexin type 1 inhibitor, like [Fundulus heteroclitus]
MASLGLLLLGAALIHATQTLPAARGGGRGLDVSVSGIRRQRRDLRNRMPYEDQMMSYPAMQAGGGANDLYYQSEDWRGRGIDQALQRLVERDQRREQEEEQRAAYLAALLRLLSEAENAGLVGPRDVEVVEEEEDEEDDQGLPGDFQVRDDADYDETGRGMSMGRPNAPWWDLVEPQLVQAMLDRMDPRLVQSLLQRAGEPGRTLTGPSRDQDALRRMVAKILSSLSSSDAQVMMSSGRRAKRDVSSKAEAISPAHRRARRSLDNMAPLSPSNEPPLLRVKRLEEEEEEEEGEKLHPQVTGLQRMKRIDTMATGDPDEMNHGSRRRRRRAVLNYDPQMLMDQIVDYLRE